MCDTLPENADRALFAEDFVNHVLRRLEVPYQYRSGFADHRARVYNAFNWEIGTAVDYGYRSHRQDIDGVFEDISKQITIDFEGFVTYTIYLRRAVKAYPMPKRLMHFCFNIAMMAGKFYMSGFLNAPFLAVESIIHLLKVVDIDEAGYMDLNLAARCWSQYYVDLDTHNVTPDLSSDSDRENSDASNSSDHEVGGGEDQYNIPEELTDDEMHVDAVDFLSKEAVISSSSDSEQIDKTCDVAAKSIVKSSYSTSDNSLPGSYGEKNSEDSSHSYEDISSDVEPKQNKKSPCSNSEKFDSGSIKSEKDLNTVGYKDSSDMQLNEKQLPF